MLGVTAAITAGALVVLLASSLRLARTDLSVNPLVKRIAATATAGDGDGDEAEPAASEDRARDEVTV